MAERTLLIIQDNLQFGGHEIMLLTFLPTLLGRPEVGRVVFAYPEGNAALDDRLRALSSPKLALHPWPWHRRGGEPYLASLRLEYRRALKRLYDELRPDTVLLIQGRIENGVVPTVTLPRRARIVSYLPMAHGMAEIGRSAIVGDRVRRRLYRRPDRFIVPSASVAAQLVRVGAKAPVSVVENVVTVKPTSGRDAARAAFDLPAERRIAMFLGRFDTAQKGLDLLAAAIRRRAGGLADWTLLFVGDGDGRPMLETLAAELAGKVDIRLRPFSDRPQDCLAAADILLLPSRWEGVPLVMLEAMQVGLPVLGSGIDVFTEYLPPANRIAIETDDLAAALDRALEPGAVCAFRERAERRKDAASAARSAEAFADAVLA